MRWLLLFRNWACRCDFGWSSGHRRRYCTGRAASAQKLGLPQVTYVEEILKCADGKMTVKRHNRRRCGDCGSSVALVLTVNGSAAPCRPRKRQAGDEIQARHGADGEASGRVGLCRRVRKETLPDFGTVEYGRCGCRLEAVRPERFATKVKAVQNIVFKAKESKVLTASDADVEGLIQELLANHTIG